MAERGGSVCYLMPRGDVTVIRAGLALGWRWSFTVCQPGLGIVTRVSVGGLGREGGGGKGGVSEEQSSKR